MLNFEASIGSSLPVSNTPSKALNPIPLPPDGQ